MKFLTLPDYLAYIGKDEETLDEEELRRKKALVAGYNLGVMAGIKFVNPELTSKQIYDMVIASET